MSVFRVFRWKRRHRQPPSIFCANICAKLAPRRIFGANERRVRASRTRTRRGSRAGSRRGSSPRSVSTHLFFPARERVVHSRRGALEPRPRRGVERVGAHFRGVVARRSTRLEAHAGAGVVRSDARRGTPSGFAVSAARVDWTRGRKRRRAAESAARGIARARSAFIRRSTNSREKTCACRRAGGLARPTLRESLAILKTPDRLSSLHFTNVRSSSVQELGRSGRKFSIVFRPWLFSLIVPSRGHCGDAPGGSAKELPRPPGVSRRDPVRDRGHAGSIARGRAGARTTARTGGGKAARCRRGPQGRPSCTRATP